MTRLSLASLAGNVALLFVVAFLLIGQGKRDARIRELGADLVTAGAALRKAADDIERFAAAEGITASEAARVCAAEGGTAFERGRAFGRAELEAAQCPAS